jgi:hypothetical protein
MKRGESGEAGRRNVSFVAEGVRERRNVVALGDIAQSKMDNGDAGRSGEASSCQCTFPGGKRNQLMGEFGDAVNAWLAAVSPHGCEEIGVMSSRG